MPHFITKSSFSFLFATLHHPVFLFLSLCHTSSPSLPFPFSLPHFITQSSFSFLFAILHHPFFLFLSLCHTSSTSLPFPFSLSHFITQSSFSFLFATLHHPVFLFLSLCHTSSPSLPFHFSLPHLITQSSFSFLFATLHHPVFLFLSLCHTSSPGLPFPFSLPHFITQSSFSFLFATLHHQVFLFLSRCHTSSPSLSFPFSLPHIITQSSLSFLFATLHHQVFLFLSLCHISSPGLLFPFSLPYFITKSSFSFLVATLHHPVFLFLSFCHTSSPSLPFPFSLTHFITQSSFPFSLPHFITQSSFSFLFDSLHHLVFLLKNSKDLLDNLKSRSFSQVSAIKTFDFSTLYTNLLHDKLKSRLTETIHKAFSHRNYGSKFVVLGYNSTYFSNKIQKGKTCYSEEQVISMLEFFIDNKFVSFEGTLLQQVFGIPMGTNCAPLLADLFLYSYESEFLQKLVKDKKIHEARAFNFTYRYIDDVLSINNFRFAEFLPLIYPPELEVKETTDTASSASFLDLYLTTVINSVLKFMINETTSILKS